MQALFKLGGNDSFRRMIPSSTKRIGTDVHDIIFYCFNPDKGLREVHFKLEPPVSYCIVRIAFGEGMHNCQQKSQLEGDKVTPIISYDIYEREENRGTYNSIMYSFFVLGVSFRYGKRYSEDPLYLSSSFFNQGWIFTLRYFIPLLLLKCILP